ncbi:flagellar biosynthetic protein FliO [Sphingomonas sp. CJ20]
MDIFSMLRTLGALGMVLGMLAGALWVVRRYDLKLPGRITSGRGKRVELVERLSVDAKRSVALIRRDGCEHLILLGPEGHAMLETGITAPPAPEPAPKPARPPRTVPRLVPTPAAERAPVPAPGFGTLIDFTTAAARLTPAPAPEAQPEADAAIEPEPEQAEPAAPRTRAPRVTARWNRAAVREALNA